MAKRALVEQDRAQERGRDESGNKHKGMPVLSSEKPWCLPAL